MSLSIGMAACVFRSVEILAVARQAGFDFLMADMEHGAMSLGDVAALCVAGREAGFPVHVRVPAAHSEYLTRVVDCGARGVIVPHVDSASTARSIVDKVRFAPVGHRSVPSPIAVTGFRPVPVAELVEQAEAALQVTVMIESMDGLAEVARIAAVPGIDTVMVGPNDLAESLGRRSDLDHPDVLRAFSKIAEAATAAGKQFAVIGIPPEKLHSHALDFGAGMIVAANEINLLFDAAAARVSEIRTCIGDHQRQPVAATIPETG